jgi:hypothetical protein
MAVIWTRSEAMTPTAVPIRIPIRIRTPLPITSSERVTATATSIPAAAIRLPRRAVRGCVPCWIPKMNREKATM